MYTPKSELKEDYEMRITKDRIESHRKINIIIVYIFLLSFCKLSIILYI